MFRAFFMKYRYPLAYAATKVVANYIHDNVLGQTRLPRARASSPEYRAMMGWADTGAISQYPAPVTELPETLRPVRATAPLYEARSASPVLERPRRDYSRPAAVKRNGGLRGSTASRWK